MNFVVCVKQTPDTAELPKITAEQAASGEVQATLVLNPWDEYAVEEALLLQEDHDGEVTVMTVGPEKATEALKDALARGANQAVLLNDPAFINSDAWGTAAILAAAIRKHGDFDLILTGKQSVDGNSGLVAPALARKLGISLLTQVAKVVEIGEGKITVERLLEEGRETVTAPLPALISVTKEINEPRYPSFMGIRRAARAKIPVWGAADLELDPASVGQAAATARWDEIRKPPARASECVIVDEGSVETSAARLADLLIAEKVI